ncbi:MAG TPA: DNA repair protein RecN [Anaerolineales bacterium]
MLSELRIRDFAIIGKLDLNFGPGFTVFSGETGAGKSIIIDAVELLLGGRADSTMLRSGAQAAIIEGDFLPDPERLPEIGALLEQDDLLDDSGTLLLAREIRREGRNICRINGRTVGLNQLKAIGEWLVDVHGQSEHLSLLRVREHLQFLDRFAKSDGLLAEYRVGFRRLQELRRRLTELQSAAQERERRADLLRYQINEIESAALREGETAQLAAERERLANAEKLAGLTLNALAALDEAAGSENSAIDRLGEAAGALLHLGEIDPSMHGPSERAQALAEELGDLARQLRGYLEQVQPDPLRLDEVEARVGLIADLSRKYGADLQAIQAYAAQAQSELEGLLSAEENLEVLQAEQAQLLVRLAEVGAELSRTRRRAAETLAEQVADGLAELNMAGAQFAVDVQWQDDPQGLPVEGRQVGFGPTGLDTVEFLVAPNAGEGLKPLAKIASGGETSRLMLGLKSVLAQADRRPTLIFDEIDQGIGGRTGGVVGRKLWGLARSHQVLCVTHLPQLAAHGDRHFKVEKSTQSGRTLAAVRELQGAERLKELAEMLGEQTESNLRSAEVLLQNAAT